MSTIPGDLCAQINARRTHLGVTQACLAAACGLNQGHLSKVLSGKLKLAAKTETALRAWLLETADGIVPEDAEVHAIAERLSRTPSRRRMQIMQLLRLVEQLAR